MTHRITVNAVIFTHTRTRTRTPDDREKTRGQTFRRTTKYESARQLLVDHLFGKEEAPSVRERM